MKKEIRLPEELIPMAKIDLQDLEVYITLIESMGIRNAKYVAGLGETAMALSENEAKKLLAHKELHNIQNAATELTQYFGLVRMLARNIKDDLQAINNKREIYAISYADRMVEINNKQQPKEETEIAEKKYQRPVNRPAETE